MCTHLIKDRPEVSRGQRMGCMEGPSCLGARALGCPALEGCFLERQRWEPLGPRVPASIPDLVGVLVGMLSPLHLMGCVHQALRMWATLWLFPFGPDGICCFSRPGGVHETSSLTPLLSLLHRHPEISAAHLLHLSLGRCSRPNSHPYPTGPGQDHSRLSRAPGLLLLDTT